MDVITGGSPCQDLSVAGKRAGLKHSELGDDETTRSGLFMDQMRIVKEMREHDRANGRTGVLVRPRYMVWENVEGAKTSPGGEHRGEDYAAVLEEIIRVAEPDADIHVRVPDGGWPNAGCYYAEDGTWSLAWRLVDAQYFGTPQRRCRIALLADFGGLTAPEIMFDPQLERTTEGSEPLEAFTDTHASGQKVSAQSESVSRNPKPRGTTREGTPAGTESGAGSAGGCLNGWDVQSKHIQPTDGIAESLYSGECRYGGGESYLLDDQETTSYTLKIRGGVDVDSAGKRAGKGALVQTELSGTLGVSQDQTLIQTAYGLDQQGGKGGANYTKEISPPILSDSHGTPHAVCGINGDIAGTLDASYYKGCGERQGIEREVVIERQGVDLYNGQVTGDVAATISSESCVTNSRNGPYVMEDHVMAAGFSFGQSAKARSLGYEVEKAPTIRGGEGGNQKPVVLALGVDSYNQALCGEKAMPLRSCCGGDEKAMVLAVDCRNGTEDPDINGTLQAKSNGGWNYNSNNVVRETATPYGICSYESNAFKSSNPHSAIYKAETSRTLDNNGGNPSCNQGGIAVVEKCWPIEGNGARPSHFGSGFGKDGDPSFTLNHVEQHGVATYDARGNGDGEVCCTLTGDHQDRVTDYTALVVENDSTGE